MSCWSSVSLSRLCCSLLSNSRLSRSRATSSCGYTCAAGVLPQQAHGNHRANHTSRSWSVSTRRRQLSAMRRVRSPLRRPMSFSTSLAECGVNTAVLYRAQTSIRSQRWSSCLCDSCQAGRWAQCEKRSAQAWQRRHTPADGSSGSSWRAWARARQCWTSSGSRAGDTAQPATGKGGRWGECQSF